MSAAVTSEATDVATSPKRPVPPLTAPRLAAELELAERTLPTGLRVIAVRRASVPLVEVRLRVPFGGTLAEVGPSSLLAETIMSGTSTMSNVELAAELQRLGGGLSAGVDADRLVLSGNALATGLPRLLELMGDVLTDAAYPEPEVATERDRLADHIEISLAQPSTAVRQALLRRLYGDHPYSVEVPSVTHVMSVDSAELRQLHREKLLPAGSVLVIVGDAEPESMLEAAEAALARWQSAGTAPQVPPIPDVQTGPWELVGREGAVQSSIRVALPAVGRQHPDYPALQLANLIFGGYFSSRVVANIREDKGYTYSPHCVIEHGVAGSMLILDADVATEVTAPAMHEVMYELGRLATVAPEADELEDARQYAIGSLSLSLATQAGLASWLATLAGTGLELDWLTTHSRRLAEVSLAQVHAAAANYLAPAKAVTVILGDEEATFSSLQSLHTVERQL